MKSKRLCLAGYTLVAAATLGCSRSPGLSNPTAGVVESSPNVQHTVAAAWEADRSGESERALAIYLDVLSADPHNAWAKRRVEQLSVNLPARGEQVAKADTQPAERSVKAVQQVSASESIAVKADTPEPEATSNPFDDWTIESKRRTVAQPSPEAQLASSDIADDAKSASAEIFPWADESLVTTDTSRTDTINRDVAKQTEAFDDEAIFDSLANNAKPFAGSVEFSPASPTDASTSTDAVAETRPASNVSTNPFETLADSNAPATETNAVFEDISSDDHVMAPAIKTVSFSQSKSTDIPLRPTQKRLVDLCNDANAEILTLVGKLDSPVASTRRAGLHGLGLLGKKAQTAKLPVRIMFGDEEPIVSAEAAWTLWQIDGDAFQSVRHLASLLTSKDFAAADASVQSLGLIGQDAIAAAPQLRDQLNRLSGVRRVRVAEALIRIQPEDVGALQVLIESTRYGRSVERTEATYALAHTPTVHIETITPVLVNALHDENEAVRTAAALTLGSFGPRAEHARLALESAAEYDYPHVRDAARAALDCLPK